MIIINNLSIILYLWKYRYLHYAINFRFLNINSNSFLEINKIFDFFFKLILLFLIE